MSDSFNEATDPFIKDAITRRHAGEQTEDDLEIYPKVETGALPPPVERSNDVILREQLISELSYMRYLNKQLLKALRSLRDDETMPGRFLPEICRAIQEGSPSGPVPPWIAEP